MLNKKRKKWNESIGDKVFDVVTFIIMAILFVIFVWPLLFVLSASISDPNAVWTGKVIIFPVGINFDGYKEILEYENIWIGYRNTILYTFLGTIVNLIMTVCAAYPLSRKDFAMRNFFMVMFMITMYIGGGLIPTYLVVNNLHLTNTIWAMIVPSAVSIFNIIITRTFFQSNIPDSLREAAELDGANTAQFLIRIVLPLSAPILAVMALYYGIGHWNDYFTALIYLNDTKLFPLQIFLRDILIQNKMGNDLAGLDPAGVEAKMRLAQTIKYSAIVVASVPALCAYPFVQKYFVKGVMIGAVKG